MKKLLCLALALCLALSCMSICSFAAEEDDPYVLVMLNDQEVESDADPFIANDRTMVGLRGIFEQMGAKVIWNEEESSVIITTMEENGTGREVKLIIGDANVTVTSNETGTEIVEDYVMDVVPIVVNDRTFVPLRFVAETFDCVVDYYVNEASSTEIAVIYTPDYEYTDLLALFESTYQVSPIEDEAIPVEENTYYYELGDELLLPMGKDHLIAFRNQVANLNFYGSYTYDDVTAYFADGSWVNNSYKITKYNESISISIVTDPRIEDANEEAYLTITDNKLDVVGTPVVKVVYSNGKTAE